MPKASLPVHASPCHQITESGSLIPPAPAPPGEKKKTYAVQWDIATGLVMLISRIVPYIGQARRSNR